MAFQKVGGNFKYVKYKECKKGQVIAQGTYLGTRQGTYGPQYQIRDDEGDITVLNDSGQLKFTLENHVSKGDYVQVVYNGKIVLDKGKFKGKESHQFEVLVDPDRKTDGSSLAAVDTSASSSEDDELDEEDERPAPRKVKAAPEPVADSDDEDEDLGDDEEEEEAKAPPAAAKKKMSSDELLAKYRKKGA